MDEEKPGRPLIVAVDTETTGMGHFARPPRNDGVVQVGLAYRDRFDKIETWSEYCNPGSEFLRPGWADEALGVNGLTRQRVLGFPPVAKVAGLLHEKLAAIRRESDRPIQLRAYNREFDQPFLAAEPWRVPADTWGPCIMLDATAHLDGPDARWVGLKAAMTRLGLQWPGRSHDAASDSHAALLVLEAISR